MSVERRHIITGTLFLSSSATIRKVVSLFVFIILISHLDVHDYGVLVLLFSIPGIVVGTASFGIGELLLSEIARMRSSGNLIKIRNLMIGYLLAGIALILIIVGISFPLKAYLADKYTIYLVQFYGWVLLFIFGQYFLNYILILLSGFEDFFKKSVIEVGEPLLRLGMLLVAFNFLNINTNVAFATYAISKVVIALLGVVISRRILFSVFSAAKSAKSELYMLIRRTGKWIIAQDILNRILQNINPWLIKAFISVEAIAIFDVALRIYSAIENTVPIQNVLLPVISRNVGKPIVSIIIRKARKYYALFALVVIIGVWLLADRVILGFAPQYIESSLILKIFIFKFLIDILRLGQRSLLFAYQRQRFLFGMFIFGFVQTLLFNTLLLYYIGLVGLVLSVLLRALTSRIITEIYIKKHLDVLRFRMSDYFKYDEYDRMIVDAIWRRLGRAFRFLSFQKTG